MPVGERRIGRICKIRLLQSVIERPKTRSKGIRIAFVVSSWVSRVLSGWQRKQSRITNQQFVRAIPVPKPQFVGGFAVP